MSLVARPEAPSFRRILTVAALFAAWANVHGGWLVGAGVLGVYAAARAGRCPGERLRWASLVVAAVGATLLTPYGIQMWELLAATVRPSRPEITEWQPLDASTSLLHWLPIVSVSLVWAFVASRQRTRPPVEVTLTILILVVASSRALRIGPLIAPAALMLLGPHLVQALGATGRIVVRGRSAARVMWMPVLAIVAAVAQPIPALVRCIDMQGPWVPDRLAAANLKGMSGRMWTTFSWGQYSNWQFGPALRVSIDGRLEVYSDEVRQLHRDFEAGAEAARQEFLRLDPDVVWLPARLADVKLWLVRHGYRIDLETAESFVAVKASLPPLPGGREALPVCFQ